MTEAGGRDETGAVCNIETGGKGSDGKFGKITGEARAELSKDAGTEGGGADLDAS
jgi:hypothetical protein